MQIFFYQILSLITLHVKSIIFFAAIHTQFLSTHQFNPIGTGAFATTFTYIRVKYLRWFRKSNCSLFHLKQLLWFAALIIFEALFFCHSFCSWFQHQTHRLSRAAIIERKCLFSAHVESHISRTPHYFFRQSL